MVIGIKWMEKIIIKTDLANGHLYDIPTCICISF